MLGWGGIARLGLVQAGLGAVVVLTTSTLNRVMVVELALPALLPGVLVALHYLVQVLRPRMGHGSDLGGRRTPWIAGGMAVLAFGGVLAALATVWMASNRAAGIALAVVAFGLIGVGVSACGTSLLVLLAKRVAPPRRAAAATIVWMMMIVGFAVTAGVAGHLLDPYSPLRLVVVTLGVSVLALAVALLALRGVEGAAPDRPESEKALLQARALTPSPLWGEGWGRSGAFEPHAASPRSGLGLQAQTRPAREGPAGTAALHAHPAFREALSQVWADPAARHFTLFVFVSMLAFSAQDLILEPFAGSVFGFTPGQSTQLSGVQHGGVLLGMIVVALAGQRFAGRAFGSLRGWTVGGCVASGFALLGLVAAGLVGSGWPLAATVFALGAANGAFSIAAIASMMRLAGEGGASNEGVRMGLWGAAQAVAFGLGGLVGTAASDLSRWLMGSPGAAYSAVFAFEALLFFVAAAMATKVGQYSVAPVPSRSEAFDHRVAGRLSAGT